MRINAITKESVIPKILSKKASNGYDSWVLWNCYFLIQPGTYGSLVRRLLWFQINHLCKVMRNFYEKLHDWNILSWLRDGVYARKREFKKNPASARSCLYHLQRIVIITVAAITEFHGRALAWRCNRFATVSQQTPTHRCHWR